MIALYIAIAILLIGLVAWLSHLQEKARREAFERLARNLNLQYRPEADETRMGGRFDHIDLLRSGSNRYTKHHLSGTIDGVFVAACDFHYETYSTNSKGQRTTHHHWLGVVFVEVPLFMSEVRIRREGWLDKLAGVIGLDDIDFESAEFSRRFHVKAADRRFAYDLIHSRAMEYLLAHDGYSWEFEGSAIALYRNGTFEPAEAIEAIRVAVGFVPLIPEHVRADRGRQRLEPWS